jgi:CubicO group peptidase (beta-lactamase class C family)
MIVRQVSGMELEQFVRTRLAEPMGWGRWGWGYRRPEIAHTPGGGGIAPRATDMLRFAYLLLREGRWGERQLIPAEYVRHCGRPSPYNPHAPVSLAFDVNGDGHVPGVPRDAFWKQGSGGHCFYVVPSLDLVVWKLGGRDEQYSAANTGLEPVTPPYDGSREGWKPALEAGPAALRTLQLVAAAVQ